MNTTSPSAQAFHYQAQTPDGAPLSGTIDAADGRDAQSRLAGLGLVVSELSPAPSAPPRAPGGRGGTISGEQFIAFNRQLAELTGAGLPLEKGLHLMADDAPSKPLARTICAVAEDLEAGTPPAEAFDNHRSRFPAHFGSIVESGIRTGNLHGVLMNLAEHARLTRRLRNALWNALAYPLIVLVMVVLVAVFVGHVIAPQIEAFFEGFGSQVDLPWLTRVLFGFADAVPWLTLGLAGVVVLTMLIWGDARRRGKERMLAEALFHPVPLVGSVLKATGVARWCAAAKLAVSSGLPLDQAMQMAGQATGSPALVRDSSTLAAAVAEGRALVEADCLRALPRSVCAGIDLGAARGDLAETLGTLTDVHDERAEDRLATLRLAMIPISLVVLATVIGFVMAAIFMPLPEIITGVMRGVIGG